MGDSLFFFFLTMLFRFEMDDLHTQLMKTRYDGNDQVTQGPTVAFGIVC